MQGSNCGAASAIQALRPAKDSEIYSTKVKIYNDLGIPWIRDLIHEKAISKTTVQGYIRPPLAGTSRKTAEDQRDASLQKERIEENQISPQNIYFCLLIHKEIKKADTKRMSKYLNTKFRNFKQPKNVLHRKSFKRLAFFFSFGLIVSFTKFL